MRQTSTLDVLSQIVVAIMMVAVPATIFLTGSPAAFSQASSSTDAVGTVTDASGAVVPGATIHLINNGTKAERVTKSNAAGEWSIPNIPPTDYTVRVEKSGFRTSVISSLPAEIGKTANGSVVLAVGGMEETVEVTTLPPQLQTQEATVGQVIDQKQINDLPLNGRNVLQLATLAPGVSPPQTGQTGQPAQTGTMTSSRALYITVDGGRGNSTNYVLDGTYVRSVRFNNMSLLPDVDALQEFNLLRSTFGTEYGQGQAVVSMVTKSGTNSIHGSVYEFARNGIFDARSYFAPTYSTVGGKQVFNPKPDFYRHQFGASFGAPIIKNKAFIFGAYEGQRSQRGTLLTALFPTQTELAGTWDANSTQALPGPSGGYNYSKTNPAGFKVTNSAAVVLNPTYPVVSSDAPSILGSSNSELNLPFIDNYDEYTIRGDVTLTSKHSMFGRYVNYSASQITPTTAPTGSSTSNPLLGRNAVLGDTYIITSKLVNEARIGWNEFYNITLGVLQSAGPNGNWAAAEGLQNITALTSPRQNGRATFTINGFSSVGDGSGDQGGHENVISIGDTLSDVIGRHTLKFGFQGQNRRLWQVADNNSRGAATFDNCTAATYGKVNGAQYTPTGPDDPNNVVSAGNCLMGTKSYSINGQTFLYNKFQNYARGMCTSGCNGNAGSSLGHYRDNTYGLFISDVWDIGHHLTANLGFRWEYNQPFHEQNGLEGTLDPTTGLITFTKLPSVIPPAYLPYIDQQHTYQAGIIKPFHKGFMPRIGLAYEAHPGTVLRAGYGMYFDNLNTNELQFTRYAPPLYFQQAFSNVFVNGGTITAGNTTTIQPALWPDPTRSTQIPSPFSIFPNNTQPLTQEWNASIQQDLGHGTILEMAFTGSNTHHMWKRFDQNMYIQYPFQIPTSFVRPYPQFGNGILTSSTLGSANFSGGSVKVEKRSKNGLYFLGSYQWSKNLDNISGEAGANDSSFATTQHFDHSYSNFDVRNRAVISGGYELPFGKNKPFLHDRVSNAVLGGWSFQPAVQLRGGYPFNITGSGCTFASYNTCRVFLAPGRTVASSYKTRQTRNVSNWFDPTAYSQDPSGPTVCAPGQLCTGLYSNGTAANIDCRNSTVYCSVARPFPNLQGWVTRNTGRGPGTVSFDLSGIKNFKIHERLTMQFRAEAYNIINHGIFSNPSGAIGTPTSVGRITSTSTGSAQADNRSIQLALKALF